MDRVKLPARVRLSRLPGPPGEGVLSALRRLAPEAPLDRLAALPREGLVCAVVIAGGKVVGFALRDGAEEFSGLEPTWRGRGIEAALAEELAQA